MPITFDETRFCDSCGWITARWEDYCDDCRPRYCGSCECEIDTGDYCDECGDEPELVRSGPNLRHFPPVPDDPEDR